MLRAGPLSTLTTENSSILGRLVLCWASYWRFAASLCDTLVGNCFCFPDSVLSCHLQNLRSGLASSHSMSQRPPCPIIRSIAKSATTSLNITVALREDQHRIGQCCSMGHPEPESQ